MGVETFSTRQPQPGSWPDGARRNRPAASGMCHDALARQEPQLVLARTHASDTKDALIAETSIARDLGIFGSPTFAIGRELFWGDDRLEDAMSWYKYSGVQPSR